MVADPYKAVGLAIIRTLSDGRDVTQLGASRRKPQDLVYFSIDYFVINASLPR
jgi:hypothetical protein